MSKLANFRGNKNRTSLLGVPSVIGGLVRGERSSSTAEARGLRGLPCRACDSIMKPTIAIYIILQLTKTPFHLKSDRKQKQRGKNLHQGKYYLVSRFISNCCALSCTCSIDAEQYQRFPDERPNLLAAFEDLWFEIKDKHFLPL